MILIELGLIFGCALAFGWWQLRDLDREKRRRDAARRTSADGGPPPHP